MERDQSTVNATGVAGSGAGAGAGAGAAALPGAGAGAGSGAGAGAPHNANLQDVYTAAVTSSLAADADLRGARRAQTTAQAKVDALQVQLLREHSEAQARELVLAERVLERTRANVAECKADAERSNARLARVESELDASRAPTQGPLHSTPLTPGQVLQAMTEAARITAQLSGETKYSVTAEEVHELFFTHAKSHSGKVPVKTKSRGTLDEEGWLWRKVVGQDAPPMPNTLARQLDAQIPHDKGMLFLVVAPSGAGKSFGAWQLGTIRHVDLLDANRNDEKSLFSLWRRTVTANKLPDDLVLKLGETAATVGQLKLNSRKAVYHAWILLCSLTAMRAQCSGPSHWLFLQRHRSLQVIAGYKAAMAVAKKHRLHYESLAELVPLDGTRGPPTVLVVDEASHALPRKPDPAFAPLGAASPKPVAPCADSDAGRLAVACRKTEADGSTTKDDGSTTEHKESYSGLLGCLLQAAMHMGRCTVAMGTSFSFAAAARVAQSGSDHPLWARNTHTTEGPYMAVDAFPQLSADECAEYIKFYAKRLRVELDPDVLSDVCQQLQGRPSFVHYFIMRFVWKPSANLKHIWSHGEVPNPAGPLPDCGAKQLLFSRLCAHYTTVVGSMDAETARIFHALLRQLAMHYVFGGPSAEVKISSTADHPFDFTDAGLAYLDADSMGEGSYTLREPLAVELCAHLSRALGATPGSVDAWGLLVQMNTDGTGATGHVLERAVGNFLVASRLQLRVWLQRLHKVVSSATLDLPDWCDDSISFAKLSRTVRDDATGQWLLQLLNTMHEDDTPDFPVVFPSRDARPDVAVVPAPSVLMLIGCKLLEGHSNHSGTIADNFASTDVTRLYMKGDSVINSKLRNEAMGALNAQAVHRVRVGFSVGHKAVGSVTVEHGEVHVVISAPMVETAFGDMPWRKLVVQHMCHAGIVPQVQLLGENAADTAARLKLHVRGFGKALSGQWATALPHLRAEYDNTSETTRITVAGVVGIIDSVFTRTKRVRDALFKPDNVAVWKFGEFVFTPEALVAFAALKKRGASRPRSHRKHKKARTLKRDSGDTAGQAPLTPSNPRRLAKRRRTRSLIDVGGEGRSDGE